MILSYLSIQLLYIVPTMSSTGAPRGQSLKSSHNGLPSISQPKRQLYLDISYQTSREF